MKSVFRKLKTLLEGSEQARLQVLKNFYIFATDCDFDKAYSLFKKSMLVICFATTIVKKTHRKVIKEALKEAMCILVKINKKKGRSQ